jgi:hypothetical protein
MAENEPNEPPAEDAAKDAVAGGPAIVSPKARTSGRRTTKAKTAAEPTPAPQAEPVTGSAAPDASASLPAQPPRVVSGETLTLAQGGLPVVNAKSVDIHQGGIGRASATDIAVSQGGVGLARGERVSVELGGIGAAIGGEIRVTQGAAAAIVGREVHLEQGIVRTVVANEVYAERTTGVFLLVARHVDGDVRALLDWRGALALGAAFGLVSSLFRRRR